MLTTHHFLFRKRRSYEARLGEDERKACLLLASEKELAGEELALCSRVVDGIFGSRDFNGRAVAVWEKEDASSPLKKVLFSLGTLAYKTIHLYNIEASIGRAERAWELVKAGKPVQSHILREELRTFESLAKSSEMFHKLGTRLNGGGPMFARLLLLVERIKNWQDEVLQALKKETESFPRTGDIVSYTLENDRYITGSSRSKLVKYFYSLLGGNDATHSAIRLGECDSHMWGVPSLYALSPSNVGSYGNKFYRPQVKGFIDEIAWKEKICKVYGVDESEFENLISRLLGECVEEWHETNKNLLAKLRNDAHYRILVALMVNVFSLFPKPWRQRCQFQSDWLRDKYQVACSEFVIKVVLQSGDLLGKKLAQKLRSLDSIDLSGESIVNPNIDPRRRLSRFSPGLLVHRSLILGLTKQVPPSTLWHAMIK